MRVDPDAAWIVIKRPNSAAFYVDINAQDIDGVVARFHAIGEDPDKFDAFCRSVQTGF